MTSLLHDTWQNDERDRKTGWKQPNKPLQEGTTKRVLLNCFQYIYLQELHNINQQPRYLKIQRERQEGGKAEKI